MSVRGIPPGPAADGIKPGGGPGGGRPAAGGNGDFARILGDKLAVKFSAHASERLRSRKLSPEEMAKIKKGIERAAGKGSRDSLLLLPDLALVVNVPNRTVVTAVEGERMKEGVFTNIDSAVIV